MPVQDRHPQYKRKEYEMRQLRDTIAGMSSVKSSGPLYLPIPTSMYMNSDGQPPTGITMDSKNFFGEGSPLSDALNDAPFKSNIPAYQAYLQRARFPDIVSLLVRGLTGVSVKKKPQVNLPDDISYLENNATRDGKSLPQLFAWMVSETLSMGRVTLLLDVKDNGELVIVPYVAESLINWKQGKYEDKDILSLAVFHSSKDDNEDEFSHEPEDCYFVVRDYVVIPNENGGATKEPMYSTQKYDGDSPDSVVVPRLRGTPFPFPPVVSCGANGVNFNFGPSPLIGVSDIAISIYQKEADMAQAEFLTCNPMLVISGATPEEGPKSVGSNVCLTLPDSESKAYYVEPKSSCLTHMKTRIDGLMEEAVQYGVSIIGSSGTNPNEAADTVRMRQQSSNANLRTVITSVSTAINQILEYAYTWEKGLAETSMPETPDGEEPYGFFPSTELSEMDLSPQEQTALLQSYLNNAISLETFLSRLKEGGLNLAGKTVEGELDLISKGGILMDDIDEDMDEELEE